VDPRHLRQGRRDLLEVAALALLSAGKRRLRPHPQDAIDDEAAHQCSKAASASIDRRVRGSEASPGSGRDQCRRPGIAQRPACRRRRSRSFSATQRVRRSMRGRGRPPLARVAPLILEQRRLRGAGRGRRASPAARPCGASPARRNPSSARSRRRCGWGSRRQGRSHGPRRRP
jgi:hypothetical protein